jgi:hypothetical protein
MRKGTFPCERLVPRGGRPRDERSCLQVPVEAARHRLVPYANFALHQAHRGTEAVAPFALSSDPPLILFEWL